MTGKCGEHLFVDVPIGTLVKSPPVFSDADPLNLKDVTVVTATKVLADLDEHGSMFLAGKGGMGGMGAYYQFSQTIQSDYFISPRKR